MSSWYVIWVHFEVHFISLYRHDTVCNTTRNSATPEKQRVSCPHQGEGDYTLQSTLPPLATPMRMVESESHNVHCTFVKRDVRKAHFKMNRAFKVIQGHPYWCRQESRMVCCRNVHLMPTSFLKLRYGNGKTANSSISTTSRRFEDVPA